jgi:hypothetical protein
VQTAEGPRGDRPRRPEIPLGRKNRIVRRGGLHRAGDSQRGMTPRASTIRMSAAHGPAGRDWRRFGQRGSSCSRDLAVRARRRSLGGPFFRWISLVNGKPAEPARSSAPLTRLIRRNSCDQGIDGGTDRGGRSLKSRRVFSRSPAPFAEGCAQRFIRFEVLLHRPNFPSSACGRRQPRSGGMRGKLQDSRKAVRPRRSPIFDLASAASASGFRRFAPRC